MTIATAHPARIRATDGKEMVLISSGDFQMGSERGYSEERPIHTAHVNSFYMDTRLVTNREYKAYCDATRTAYPPNPRWKESPHYFLDYPDYPVVNVSWRQAMDYAEWAGKRLPSEEEWEYAACGGQVQPLYPWGDVQPDGQRANFADRNTEFPWRDFHVSDGYRYASPVGAFPPNAYGLFDMAGNVFQWVEDWFFDYSDTLHDTEKFKDGWGGSKVCRGGCYHSSAFDLRVARRRQILGGGPNMAVGFRCVKDAEGAQGVHHPKVEFEIGHNDESWKATLDNVHASVQPGMQLCCGTGKLTLEQARHLKNMGFTSVEQYVTWETLENNGEGQWDFSAWDEQVAILQEVGLKWVPFLIAGPAYSLPDWCRESEDFEGLRCLEHNIETKIHSIWAPRWRAMVERYIARFAEHYRDTGVVQWPLLGITGDFGEAIFPAWHGNWPPQISGLYHSHGGYWCADRFAQADFRAGMATRFKNIAALNKSWGTRFPSFEAVTMPEIDSDPLAGFRVDEVTEPGTFKMRNTADRRRWLDFIDWYRAAMTDYADFWLRITSRYFPGTPVYLCTGGRAEPWHASEFAQQCKVAARHNGGVRITNEASVYAMNFLVTNWVASASAFYGAQFSFEPAGMVTEKGIVCRIYNATATGANELHFYEGNIVDQPHKPNLLMKNLAHLYRSQPVVDIGLLYPDVPMMMERMSWDEVVRQTALLRDYTNFRFIDDLTIADGILAQLKVVVICGGELYRKATLEALSRWVDQGGLLVVYNTPALHAVEDDTDYAAALLSGVGGEWRVGQGATFTGRKMPTVDAQTAQAQARRTDPIGGALAADATMIAAYQQALFDPITAFLQRHGYHVADGVIDGVYTAQLSDKLLVLNTHLSAMDKGVTLPDGSMRQLALDANSITPVML
jgi:formylglycine-generating enzyme required for sulfatase activity